MVDVTARSLHIFREQGSPEVAEGQRKLRLELHATATRAAERLRQESEEAAAEARTRAEQAAQRREEKATQELMRLTSLQDDVRGELSRLAGVLATELGRSAPAPRDGENPVPGRRGGHASQAAAG
ncbi:hypothetical protein [Pseudonocardia sp.]|uniref:hypothetical protein n=1 Tax=Pseudonocardia sp. TaxID=60912 RepID=UPI003D132CF7